jgi:hypothetical protein
MVRALGDPPDPMPEGLTCQWGPGGRAFWRVYHRDPFTPDATHRRSFGPLHRFDHHTADIKHPAEDESGRTVSYVAERLTTATAEVFDGPGVALVCPSYRGALVRLEATATFQDLRGEGAMTIGALPGLATGAINREHSQRWARAIYARCRVAGIVYPGAHDFGLCAVLWERAGPLGVVADAGIPQDFSLRDPVLWARLQVGLPRLNIALREVEPSSCALCVSAGIA